jgi:hypothetical protein
MNMGEVIDTNGSKPRTPQSRRAVAELVINKTPGKVVEMLLALSDNLDGRVLHKLR